MTRARKKAAFWICYFVVWVVFSAAFAVLLNNLMHGIIAANLCAIMFNITGLRYVWPREEP